MKQQYCFNCMSPLGKQPYCGRCGSNSRAVAAAEPYHLPCGTTLANRYVVGKALGEGGFGITYIGLDTVLSKRVAVKEFYPAGIAVRNGAEATAVQVLQEHARFFEKGVERFLFEAKSVAAFSDEEGIVDVQDYFQENNTAYIVMDFLDGENLKEYVARHGVFDIDELIRLLQPVMKGLKDMHAKGIIHRDISPDNIMFTKKGQLKLTDFGSAKYYSGSERQNAVILKHGYAPEEQYRSDSEQGPYTDIYALCATVYYCITGNVPVPAPDRAKEDTLPPPSQLGTDIRPSREKALMHGLAVEAKKRTPDMDALMRELGAADGKSTAQKPPQPQPKTPPASPNEYPNALKKRDPAAPLPTKSFHKTIFSPRRSRFFKVAAVVVPVLLVMALIVSAVYMAGKGSGRRKDVSQNSAQSRVNIQELLSGIDSRPSQPNNAQSSQKEAAQETTVPPAPLTMEQAQAHSGEIAAFFNKNAVHNDHEARYGDVIGLYRVYYSESKNNPGTCYIAFAYRNNTLGYYKVMYLSADNFSETGGSLTAHTTLMNVTERADSLSEALDNCWFLKNRYSSNSQFNNTTL